MKRRISILVFSIIMAIAFSLGLSACATKVENVELNFVVDGQAIATISTSGKEVVAIPDNPQKDGYSFDGWYWDKDVWDKPFTANSLLNASISSDMSVYAKMTAIQYTVTYHLDGGANTNPATYTVESSTITLGDAVKEGYTFNGWYKEAEHTDKVTTIPKGSTGNLELYAYFTINQYTISFDSDGGTATESVTGDYGKAVSAPATPVKVGYDFGGWYEGESATAYEFTTMPAKDVSLVAKWSATEYDITYDLNGGINGENPVKYTIETDTITLSDAVRDGYAFDGWYDGDNKVEVIEKGSMGEVELTAHWTVIEYTATFKIENVTVKTVKFTVEDTILDAPEIPNKNGYITAWEEYSVSAQDIIVNAIYTAIEYTITYENTKDVANNNVMNYTVESDEITLSDISAVGYIFDGWYDGVNKVESIAAGSYGDKTLNAKWTVIEYTLTLDYDENMGEYAAGAFNPVKYTVESAFDLIGLQSKVVGVMFDGWYTAKNDGQGEKVTAIALGSTGDLTLYAHWTLETYTITYHNVDGVTNTNATTYTVQTEDFTVSGVSKIGYMFDGWYSDSALQNVAATTVVKGSHGNLDYYAKWTPIVYNISYTLYGGTYVSGGNPENYTIEDGITLLNPVQTNKIFVGWYTLAENGELIKQISTGTTGNIALYARWLTFNSNGGSEIDYTPEFSANGLTAPTEPIKDYYGFGGWYFDEQLTYKYDFKSLPSTSGTLYAKWSATKYSITYILDGGVNNKSNPVKYTVEDDIVFADADKTGYTFNGWFSDAQFTSAVVTEIAVGSHGDITVYAHFSINQYTVSFETNGGTTVAAITQNYATELSAPNSPAKNGYTFADWYSDPELKNAYSFTTMPAQNITLYAKWQLANYDIIYHLSGGTNSAQNPNKYTIESDDIIFAAPTNRGYTFAGWYSDSQYTDAVTTIDSGSYGVVEVYAKWDIITYSVTYVMPENASQTNAQTYTVESNTITLADATLAGNTFNGWYADGNYSDKITMIASGDIGDVTLYAKFTPNTYTIWLDGKEEARSVVSFNLNGASGTAPASQTVTDIVTLTYPGVPTRSGYIFGGWYDNAECNGAPYDFTAMISNDITLYAKWTEVINSQSITVGGTASVTLNGKTDKVYKFVPLASGNVSITTTGNIDTFGALYKNGVQLKQDDDSGANGNFLIVYNVTAGELYEIRVRGFSASASGTVTLNVSGNNTPNAGGYAKVGNVAAVTYGDSLFTLPVPTAEEKNKFLGWQDADGVLYTDKNGNSVRAWDKPENTLLVSKWERMEYTVTFMTNGGSAVESVTLEYGARFDINQYVTVRSGYTFGGWYLNASDSESYNASTMPDHNITLYAKWTTFALGSIKYDEDKKAVSVNDDITAELFDAICLDTNGVKAEFAVTVSGEKTAGNTITVRLVAKSGNKNKQVTISGVKVYGMPTISVTDEKSYINLNDGLKGSWFGASGTDTFGAATQIAVRIDGDYKAGDTVTVHLDSVDAADNRVTHDVENVKLYGLPVITYNEQKTAISVNDTIAPELFGASAVDSFGEALTVTAWLRSGTIAAGNTVIVGLSATDSKGNIYSRGIVCKVYGAPTIADAITTDFKVEDAITVESLGVTATDTFGELLDISLAVRSGTQTAGKVMVYTATVTDVAGNITTKDVSVKIYGTPTITVGRTDIKVNETVTIDSFSVKAKDSFNNSLDVVLEKTEGTQIGGTYMKYRFTATDLLGNSYSVEKQVAVYDENDIELTYMNMASDLIKLSSKGEEFSASATDSFSEECNITIEAASGYKLEAGKTIDLYIVATDKAGNRKLSELISEIKVYGLPIAECIYGNVWYENESMSDLAFKVTDSFGEELYFTLSVSGNIVVGNEITVEFEAEDDAGNNPLPLVLSVIAASDFTFESVDGGYAVTAYNGELTEVIIPKMYNGKSVVEISANAFKDKANIISIEIPNSVTSIGASAFYGCSGLTSITIPNSVTSIGGWALYGCNSLTSITLPFVGASKDGTSNTHFGYIFGASSYSGNSSYVPSSLKTVIIIGGTSISYNAFRNCSSLTSIEIPNGVTSIMESAFSGCSSLTSMATASGNAKYHSSGNCIIETASKTLIAGCKTSVIPADGSVTSISYEAFYGCSGLTSITIPNSVTSIGGRAFYGCNGLTSITLPFVGASKGGTSNTHFGYIFGASSYSNNSSYVPSSLKTVIITGGTSIGSSAFRGCSSLESITLPFVGASKDGTSNTHFGYIFGASSYSGNSSYVPSSLKTVIITGGTSIENFAFYDCNDLTSITIPDSVTSIGNSAFSNCSSLISITIPNSVTSIGSSAFRGCSSLESITLPFVGASKDGTSNTHFGYIFGASSSSNNSSRVPTSLKTVIITGGTSISYNAFRNCSSLTSIEIPNGVTSIESGAFYGCSSLTSITIPNSVTSIESYEFYGCSGLTSITIPNSVTSIGQYAFYDCSRLTSITIPNSVTSIESYAFYGCSGLTSITIPNSVTSIGGWAFYDCSRLTSITIPNSVTSIGGWAFSGCSRLTSITIPNSVTSIGGWAFSGCSSLTIYCEVASWPSGWDSEWNRDHRPVVWGYMNK